MRARSRSINDESGAALVLALVFITAVALLLGALVSLSGTNLLATSQLQSLRSSAYNADAIVDGAIQALRGQAPSSMTSPTCPNFPTSGSINGVVVYCRMGIPAGYYGRIVQFWACPTANGGTCPTDQANAILKSEVVYNDVKSGCTTGAIPGCYGSSWGVTLDVATWNVTLANN
jgi:hypothetical protein